MDIYVKSMRLLYYTARKYNPHAEVLITLTHYWQSRHNEYCYPSAQLLDLLLDYTEAEVVWAVREEMARTVEDVLARHTILIRNRCSNRKRGSIPKQRSITIRR